MKKEISSFSNPDIKYVLDTDAMTCTCPAFARYPGPCKHLRKVLRIPATPPNLAPVKTAPEKVDGVIYTIGHSNYDLPTFIGMLKEHKVALLIDVRSAPWSKYTPHFNRPELSEALVAAGIKYLWAGKYLGGRSSISVKDFEFWGRMNAILHLATNQNVAMMCAERNPVQCHRAYKLTPWFLEHQHEVVHIVPEGLIDARPFQSAQKADWIDSGYAS